MFPVIGIVVLILLVFGGFALTGGNLAPVLEALPHEMLIIGGAAIGSLIIGNSGKDLKALAGGIGKVFRGPTYKKADYLDRSEEHTSELQSLIRISYAVFCLKKQKI